MVGVLIFVTIISLRKHFHLQNHATLNWFTICQICLTHESLKLIKNSRKYRSSCATFYLLESSLLKIEGKQAGGVWQKYIFHWEFSLVTQRRNKELINKAMEVSISINIAQIFLLSVEPFFLLYPARVVFIYWTQYPRILQLCLIFDLQHYWSTFNILIRAEYFLHKHKHKGSSCRRTFATHKKRHKSSNGILCLYIFAEFHLNCVQNSYMLFNSSTDNLNVPTATLIIYRQVVFPLTWPQSPSFAFSDKYRPSKPMKEMLWRVYSNFKTNFNIFQTKSLKPGVSSISPSSSAVTKV